MRRVECFREGAAQQVIRADAPIEYLSSFRLRRGLNAIRGAPVSLKAKAAPASLNISTYIALATYGYTNVYELGPLLDVKTTKLPFDGTEVSR